MKQRLNQTLSSSVFKLLRPLMRILLRNGIPFGTFEDITKDIYVKVAMDEFGAPVRKNTSSRLSSITGLSRREVRRIKDLLKDLPDVDNEKIMQGFGEEYSSTGTIRDIPESNIVSPVLTPPAALDSTRSFRISRRHSRKLRVVLYSHDTMGLGHVRRNLLIAQALASSDLKPDILLVAGARETGSFTSPPGVDYLTLPSLHKDIDGKYRSRHLDIALIDLIKVRQKILLAGITAFEPDVLIVDTVPRGISGELIPTLDSLDSSGRTLCILGQRDVRDEPEVVRREWREEKYEEAIRSYYNQVWVYGDASVYDYVREYGFSSDISDMVRYTGYLHQEARLDMKCQVYGNEQARGASLPEPFVLCMVGGGQDGDHLAGAFINAELPEGLSGVLVTGPYMEQNIRHRLRREAANNPAMHILDFISEPTALLKRADSVIAMGGYNTVSEIVSFGKRALIVPRIVPRKEQMIRACRLRDLGMLDMLHPDLLNPHRISDWLKGNAYLPRRDYRDRVDMEGLVRIPHLLQTLLNESTYPESSLKVSREVSC